MNLGEIAAEVYLTLGNMPSSHPWYSYVKGSASLAGYVTRAANKLVRMAVGGNAQTADMFPELRQSWTCGPTAAGSNILSKPTDAIVITGITRAESATLPNWAVTQERPLGEPVDAKTFGLMSKDTSVVGYPKIWARKGRSILIWPTPSADYIDYLRFYGLKSETALVNDSDELFMDEQWHDAVVTLTCYGLAQRMGWKDEAATFLAQAETEIAQTVNVVAAQDNVGYTSVDGAPTQTMVYGENG